MHRWFAVAPYIRWAPTTDGRDVIPASMSEVHAKEVGRTQNVLGKVVACGAPPRRRLAALQILDGATRPPSHLRLARHSTDATLATTTTSPTRSQTACGVSAVSWAKFWEPVDESRADACRRCVELVAPSFRKSRWSPAPRLASRRASASSRR
jgi:hypothetical protein